MISIMVVGDVDLNRQALAAVLAGQRDFVTHELSLQDDLLSAARAHRPTVIVMDIDRYGADCLSAAHRLADELPESRVLLLASRPGADLLRSALAAGVWGVASLDGSPAELVRAIRRVAAGERAITPALAATAFRSTPDPLTERERAALALAAEGLRSREIAVRLYLSPGTVRNYLSAAMRKTGARNRLEAVRRAREAGWL